MNFKDITYGEERLVEIEIRWSNDAMADLALVVMRERVCDDHLDWCERMKCPKPFRYNMVSKSTVECKDGEFAQPHSFRLTRKEAFRMGICLLKFALFKIIR
jgi:hypothetical protein